MENTEKITLIREIGEVIYGERWQSALARDLGISDRTVRHWIRGVNSPRPGVYVDLSRIALEAAADLDDQAKNTIERSKALDGLADRCRIAGGW